MWCFACSYRYKGSEIRSRARCPKCGSRFMTNNAPTLTATAERRETAVSATAEKR